ncbi:MAG: hypothetical protein J2P39_14925 [Candidatus Dormibacteraeota bacterium]|nr:hypothetical protein [Candidatus Dormibacteraeota bacterium]
MFAEMNPGRRRIVWSVADSTRMTGGLEEQEREQLVAALRRCAEQLEGSRSGAPGGSSVEA